MIAEQGDCEEEGGYGQINEVRMEIIYWQGAGSTNYPV